MPRIWIVLCVVTLPATLGEIVHEMGNEAVIQTRALFGNNRLGMSSVWTGWRLTIFAPRVAPALARLQNVAQRYPDDWHIQLALAEQMARPWPSDAPSPGAVRAQYEKAIRLAGRSPTSLCCMLEWAAASIVVNADGSVSISAENAHNMGNVKWPGSIEDLSRAAKRAEIVDPDNAFYPILRACLTMAPGGDAATLRMMKDAAAKRRYSLHESESALAQHRLLRLAGLGDMESYLGTIGGAGGAYPITRSLVRAVSRMGNRFRAKGDNQRAAQCYLTAFQVARTMMETSHDLGGVLVGNACRAIVLASFSLTRDEQATYRDLSAHDERGHGRRRSNYRLRREAEKLTAYIAQVRGAREARAVRDADMRLYTARQALFAGNTKADHELARFLTAARWRFAMNAVLLQTILFLVLGTIASVPCPWRHHGARASMRGTAVWWTVFCCVPPMGFLAVCPLLARHWREVSPLFPYVVDPSPTVTAPAALAVVLLSTVLYLVATAMWPAREKHVPQRSVALSPAWTAALLSLTLFAVLTARVAVWRCESVPYLQQIAKQGTASSYWKAAGYGGVYPKARVRPLLPK